MSISITLFDGWRFGHMEENVKIQSYDDPPAVENPVPGPFEVKDAARSSPFEIEVPLAYLYGIHLDLEWEDCQ